MLPKSRNIYVKLALISDIHSNLEALTAALEAIEARGGVEAIYCLGDLVGYGADPAPCVDLARTHCTALLRGNHDEAVALERGLSALPKHGRAAALHNREHLSPDQIDFLGGLPLKLEENGCTFVHATPHEPAAWHRCGSFKMAKEQFAHFDTAICFIGHTHIPAVLSNKLGVLRVRPGNRYLVNVGSTGQPRDHNPRSCVAFFDTETFEYELERVPYDVEQAAARIEEAGLPQRLADRLKKGK